jgi:HlyD family secretion protein
MDMRRIIIAVVALVVAGGGILAFVLRKGDAATTYRFVPVQRGDVESVVTATGTLNAVRTVQVGTQVSGQIAQLYADFNDHVKKGQLIARLDPTLLQQAVQSAQAQLDGARASMQQTTFLATQEQTMYEKGVVTETEYRTAQYNAAAARAGFSSAQADLNRAEQNLKYADIYSPVDGVVIERDVDVGQTVAASFSAPQLFLIATDLSKMQILASVDESDIGQVKNGQTVTFTVQAYPNRTFNGVVSQVRMQSTTVQNVVNYTVVVNVPNPDGALLPGMTATTTFEVAKASNVLTVNNAALRFQPTAEMVAELRTRLSGARGTAGRAAGDSTQGAAGSFGAGNVRSGSFGGRRVGAGAGGAGSRGNRAMLWYVDSAGHVAVARVQTGLTNGQVTEISGPNIHEGMQIIAGVLSGSVSATTATNPFQQQQQGGFRRPGGTF